MAKNLFGGKETYKEEFGEEISSQDANSMGLNLLNLFKIIYKPMPKNEKTK